MLQHSKLTFLKAKHGGKWNEIKSGAPCFHLRTCRRRGVAASFYCAMKTLANLATQRGGKAHCWDTAPSCSYLSGNWRPVISSDMNTRTTQRCCVWWANKGWYLMTEILTSRARPSCCSVLCTIFTFASPPVLLLTPFSFFVCCCCCCCFLFCCTTAPGLFILPPSPPLSVEVPPCASASSRCPDLHTPAVINFVYSWCTVMHGSLWRRDSSGRCEQPPHVTQNPHRRTHTDSNVHTNTRMHARINQSCGSRRLT